MQTANENRVTVITLCRKCCNPMERKVGNMKWRRESEIDNVYPGTLFNVSYFWCEYCKEGRMPPEQLDSDARREQARDGQLVFVLAPIQTPSIKVRVVDWLK